MGKFSPLFDDQPDNVIRDTFVREKTWCLILSVKHKAGLKESEGKRKKAELRKEEIPLKVSTTGARFNSV